MLELQQRVDALHAVGGVGGEEDSYQAAIYYALSAKAALAEWEARER
jgi:hypothetical protein